MSPAPWQRLRRLLLGAPRDFRDPGVFHKMSLAAFLAWIGLGADGLSSSAYGPDQAFRALTERGPYTFLALFLALATALTVFIISYSYSRIIEQFPTGGGGYLVASKLLGSTAGAISGCALLVDYVLTITTSVASGGAAIFSMLPPHMRGLMLPCELAVLLLLVMLNLRGVKESVTALMPVFMLFVATHLILIVGGILSHAGRAGEVLHQVHAQLETSTATVGKWGVFAVFLSAYSRGGGTYTGIEAVSNGLPIMREPRVATGKRTMVYMAVSLAFTAGGILVAYLLFDVHPVEGKTMNAVLVEAFASRYAPRGIPVGRMFVVLTLAAEGMLLFVAAQTGFIDGPRVMSNMAVDSWLPHRFASLSDRLTAKDGVMLIGAAALALLLGTHGSVDTLVVMYSINVFVTFSLSQLAMCRFWLRDRNVHRDWWRHILVHAVGLLLCVAILVVTIVEKFRQGAWLTILITCVAFAVCASVRTHYTRLYRKLDQLTEEFENLPCHDHAGGIPDPLLPTAVLLVRDYGGVGIHSLLTLARSFPGYFKNVIFVSVAIVDSGAWKGVGEVAHLLAAAQRETDKYVVLAKRLGWNADGRVGVGVDGVAEATRLCIELSQQYPRTVFFAGRLLWHRETWWTRLLHNQTAYQVQRRLQWKGLPMTVLPLRIRESSAE